MHANRLLQGTSCTIKHSVLLALTSISMGDPPLRVTALETTAQGEGYESVYEQINYSPPTAVADYADSLQAQINTEHGPLVIDASFAITEGTAFTANVVCTDPDPSEPDTLNAVAHVELVVLSETTVDILCTSKGGAKDVEWYLSGPASASITGNYDNSIDLPVGTYDLNALLDWGSTTPHALSISSQDPDALRLLHITCTVEVSGTISLDFSQIESDPNGLPYGTSSSAQGTLPDCFVEYYFESEITWVDDIVDPITAPGFIASGHATPADCSSGGAAFAATFTIDSPHYVVWHLNTLYSTDAPEIDEVPLCVFPELGCIKLAPATWQLADGGIYDGSDVQLSLGFLPATIRVPEDAATISEGIELATQMATTIESLSEWSCVTPETLDFTIELAPGTYSGPINTAGPGVELSITARDGPGTVDIVGLSTTRCFDFSTGYTTVQISGLTFSEGTSDNGGAVRVGEGVTAHFSNCAFTSNSASDSGGAVHVSSETEVSVTFDTCTFSGNDALGNGGAVLVSGAADPTFTNCTFNGNSANNGGGAIAWLPGNSENALVTQCAIEGNYSLITGAGITHVASVGSSLTIGESVICDNVPTNISGSWQDLGGNTICMPCPGDLNNDGMVSGPDLTLMLGAWGTCPPAKDCPADINENGVVDGSDLSVVLGNWGACP